MHERSLCRSPTAGASAVNFGPPVALAPLTVTIDPEYRITTVPDAYAADGTLNLPRSWAAAIATFKRVSCPCGSN